MLKTAFLVGAVVDGLIAIEWFLISLGLVDMPIHPSFFLGSGQDFRFVLSIAGLFMMGWTLLLYWGSLKPIERRGILLLTAVMLFLAILIHNLNRLLDTFILPKPDIALVLFPPHLVTWDT
jgi:hypothetical protein